MLNWWMWGERGWKGNTVPAVAYSSRKNIRYIGSNQWSLHGRHSIGCYQLITIPSLLSTDCWPHVYLYADRGEWSSSQFNCECGQHVVSPNVVLGRVCRYKSWRNTLAEISSRIQDYGGRTTNLLLYIRITCPKHCSFFVTSAAKSASSYVN